MMHQLSVLNDYIQYKTAKSIQNIRFKYQIHGGLIGHATRQTSGYERFEASLLQRDTSSLLGTGPCQTYIPLQSLHFDREIQLSLPYKNEY